MTNTREQQLRDRYFSLMQRVDAIGAQIPRVEDVDVRDQKAMANVALLLREFEKANKELMRVAKKINRLPH